MAKKRDESLSPRIENRKARHDYHILETLEVGMQLKGSEVKSIRRGQISLAEGFARVEPNSLKLMLLGVHIAPYEQAHGASGHEPLRPKVLLAHRREIRKLLDETSANHTTLVPLAVYFLRGRAKLLLGVATGKQQQDKRQDLKKREAQRDIRRALTRKKL